MKALLEFYLDDPQDKKSHLRAVKSEDLAIVLWEIIFNSRKEVERRYDSIAGIMPLDIFYDILDELLNEHNIDIEKLID